MWLRDSRKELENLRNVMMSCRNSLKPYIEKKYGESVTLESSAGQETETDYPAAAKAGL